MIRLRRKLRKEKVKSKGKSHSSHPEAVEDFVSLPGALETQASDVLGFLDEYRTLPTHNYRYPRPRYRKGEEEQAKAPVAAEPLQPPPGTVYAAIPVHNPVSQTLLDDLVARVGRMEAKALQHSEDVQELKYHATRLLEEMNDKHNYLKTLFMDKLGALTAQVKDMERQVQNAFEIGRRMDRKYEEVVAKFEQLSNTRRAELDDIQYEQKFFRERMERLHNVDQEHYILKSDPDTILEHLEGFRQDITHRQNELEDYSVQELTKLFHNEDALRRHYTQIVEMLSLEESKASLEPHSIFRYREEPEEDDASASDPDSVTDYADGEEEHHNQNIGPSQTVVDLSDADLAKLGRIPNGDDLLDRRVSSINPKVKKNVLKGFSPQRIYKYWNAAE